MKFKLELLTCPAGDHEVILVDGGMEESQHKLSSIYWINLLRSFGIDAKHREISDEDMENQNYYKDN